MQKKLIIVSGLLVILGLVSVTTLAADKNMTSILEDWFDEQETEAIEEIDASIKKVRIEQTERLKTTLQDMIDEQEADLDEIVETEIVKRTKALKDYADELVEDIKAEHTDASKDVELPNAELDAITEDAKRQMKAVIKEAISETSKESEESEETKESGETQEESEGSEAESDNSADPEKPEAKEPEEKTDEGASDEDEKDDESLK